MDRIGLGLVSYNRPQQFARLLNVYEELFGGWVNLCAYVDGGPSIEEYRQVAERHPNIHTVVEPTNRGVGRAKNALLHHMYDLECDFFFLAEDDILPKDKRAITGYIEAYRRTGIEHFNFAHHGSINASHAPIDTDHDNGLQWHVGCVGAWSFYTRNVLNVVGFIDEAFYNAWEHVEHTFRIAEAGFTSPFWRFVDIIDSQEYIEEMPYDLVPRAIASQDNNYENVENGRMYWRRKNPNCPI